MTVKKRSTWLICGNSGRQMKDAVADASRARNQSSRAVRLGIVVFSFQHHIHKVPFTLHTRKRQKSTLLDVGWEAVAYECDEGVGKLLGWDADVDVMHLVEVCQIGRPWGARGSSHTTTIPLIRLLVN